MPRTNVTTQAPANGVLAVAMTLPLIAGDVVDTGPNTYLMFLNSSGAPVTVTVKSTAAQDGLAVADRVVAVAAGALELIGPLYGRTFGRTAEPADVGRAYIDYSSVATTTRAVVNLS